MHLLAWRRQQLGTGEAQPPPIARPFFFNSRLIAAGAALSWASASALAASCVAGRRVDRAAVTAVVPRAGPVSAREGQGRVAAGDRAEGARRSCIGEEEQEEKRRTG